MAAKKKTKKKKSKSSANSKSSSEKSLFDQLIERITSDSIMAVVIAALLIQSFFIGVLWQRVEDLSGGGGVAAPTANTGGAAGEPAQTNQQKRLADLTATAEAAGVDANDFESCMNSNNYDELVTQDFQEGTRAGVSGTPGSFLVNSNGEAWFISGAQPYEQIQPAIEVALGNEESLPPGSSIRKLTEEELEALPSVDADDHVRGSQNPSVYLIEYSDFECPFCQRFHATGVQIVEEYDQLAWVYRHYPLEQIHPKARPAAIASECIAELGGDEAFWNFADIVFGN